jgi:hypothetical protein
VVNCGVHPSLHYLNLDDTIRIGYEYDAAIAQNPTFTNFKVIIYIFFLDDDVTNRTLSTVTCMYNHPPKQPPH